MLQLYKASYCLVLLFTTIILFSFKIICLFWLSWIVSSYHCPHYLKWKKEGEGAKEWGLKKGKKRWKGTKRIKNKSWNGTFNILWKQYWIKEKNPFQKLQSKKYCGMYVCMCISICLSVYLFIYFPKKPHFTICFSFYYIHHNDDNPHVLVNSHRLPIQIKMPEMDISYTFWWK